jgi:YDG domain/MBG domain (YGX type)
LRGVLQADQAGVQVTGSGTYADKDAGENKPIAVQTVALTGAQAGNYSLDLQEIDVTGTILPKSLVLNPGSVQAEDRAYNGTTVAQISLTPGALSGPASGVVAGDTLSISASAAFADKNAGNDKALTISSLSLSGPDARNYRISSQNLGPLTADITPLGVSVVNIQVADKVYDGTTTAQASGGVISGLINGDTVTLSPGTAAFTDPNAGQDKPVVLVGFGLSGADARNYRLTAQPVALADITPASLSIQVGNFQITQGSPLPDFPLVITGLVPGQDRTELRGLNVQVNGGNSNTPGQFQIQAGGVNNPNYAITYIPGQLTVIGTRDFVSDLTTFINRPEIAPVGKPREEDAAKQGSGDEDLAVCR